VHNQKLRKFHPTRLNLLIFSKRHIYGCARGQLFIGQSGSPRLLLPLHSGNIAMERDMRTALVVAILSSVICGSASAGGLFGDDGLIGGDVGRFLDKNLEEPVLTPWARNATEGATTAVGTVIGGPIGGAVGEYVGKAINERAAGETKFARPYQYAAAPPAAGQAGSLVFRIASSAQYKVFLRFYSESRGVIWPSNSTAYVLADSEPHNLSVSCQVGENVCYGAYYSDTSKSWGLGRNNMKAGCPDCCMVCAPNQQSAEWTLGN
jgi:hypothetical protein